MRLGGIVRERDFGKASDVALHHAQTANAAPPKVVRGSVAGPLRSDPWTEGLTQDGFWFDWIAPAERLSKKRVYRCQPMPASAVCVVYGVVVSRGVYCFCTAMRVIEQCQNRLHHTAQTTLASFKLVIGQAHTRQQELLRIFGHLL